MEETTKNSMKKYTVTLDNGVETVIRYDDEGYDLFFDSTPGKFLELSKEDVSKLSARNKSNYFTAFFSWKQEEEQQKLNPIEGLEITQGFAPPKDRMNVKTPGPEFDKKWHLCWKGPATLQYDLAQGYSFVTKEDGCQTFAWDKKRDRHVVGALGHEELYLMKIRVEDYKKLVSRDEEASRIQDGQVTREALEEMKKAGAKNVKDFSDEM